DQKRYHPDGELATVRGAAAAQAATVVSDRSSQPMEKIAAAAGSAALWYQVYPEAEMAPVLARIGRAVDAGCRAVCITVGAPYQRAAGSPARLATIASPRVDWSIVDQMRKAAKVPVLLKGVMNPGEARAAAERGIAGVIVSAPAGRIVPGMASPIEML